jgi:hypothetical protein
MSAPRWQMPQHSQALTQAAQSNQNFFRNPNGGSPGAGSAPARAAVGPRQAGQACGALRDAQAVVDIATKPFEPASVRARGDTEYG